MCFCCSFLSSLILPPFILCFFFFFFNDTATTEIYTLSLHDALPISTPRSAPSAPRRGQKRSRGLVVFLCVLAGLADRKSTRLNSSHANISYAVFCLKKKKHKKLYHVQTKFDNQLVLRMRS